jgi:hypothetical protein
VAKIGRPTKSASPGERASLGLRVRPEIKEQLERAAEESGRSQSQEAEFRLESSFERSNLHREVLELMYGPQLGAILMMIGSVMGDVGVQAAFNANFTAGKPWFNDAYAFDQAVRASVRILEALRPEGDPDPPPSMVKLETVNPELASIAARIGDRFADVLIEAVAGRGANANLQRGAAEIADMLGPIAERLKTRAGDNG